jgi:hypothetical protein
MIRAIAKNIPSIKDLLLKLALRYPLFRADTYKTGKLPDLYLS